MKTSRLTSVAAFGTCFTLTALSACSDAEAPAGVFGSDCDSEGITIDFNAGAAADINRNNCEGSTLETWDFTIDGDVIVFSARGRAVGADTIQPVFTIESETELVQGPDADYLSCGNCSEGAVWTKR